MQKQDPRIEVEEVRNPPQHRPPAAYVVDSYYRPEFQELRETYALQEKTAGAKDRFEALLRISHWLGGINTFGTPPERVPMNALTVLDAIVNKGWNFECSYMPAVFEPCAQALGYNTRSVALAYDGGLFEGGAHHGASEAWVDGLDKWVYIDALHRLHYERRDVPLSLCELHQAIYDERAQDIVMVQGEERRPFPPDTSAEAKEEVYRQFNAGIIASPSASAGLYFWFAIAMNNARFANLPHHPENGNHVLFYRDRHNAEKTWYQRLHPGTDARTYHWVYWASHTTQVWSPHQVHFPLNYVHIDWQKRDGKTLDLSFETTCPNFACFHVELDGERRIEVKDPWYVWPLHPGENRLRVEAANLFGVHGTASQLAARVPGA